MANHPSAEKKARQAEAHRLRNRAQETRVKVAVKELRATKDKAKAQELLKKVFSILDKLAKTHVIHKNKASNNKRQLTEFVNRMK